MKIFLVAFCGLISAGFMMLACWIGEDKNVIIEGKIPDGYMGKHYTPNAKLHVISTG